MGVDIDEPWGDDVFSVEIDYSTFKVLDLCADYVFYLSSFDNYRSRLMAFFWSVNLRSRQDQVHVCPPVVLGVRFFFNYSSLLAHLSSIPSGLPLLANGFLWR
jgi:hypothetical protein